MHRIEAHATFNTEDDLTHCLDSICSSIDQGDHEHASEQLNNALKKHILQSHDFLRIFLAARHAKVKPAMEWIRYCFKNYCSAFFQDQELIGNYLYLERRYGNNPHKLTLIDLLLIYEKSKHSEVHHSLFYSEIIIHTKRHKHYVKEQFIISVFNDGLNNCGPHIELYKDTISTLSVMQPLNRDLIWKIYYDSLLKFDNQLPQAKEIFTILSKLRICPNTEMFKQYYQSYQDGVINLDQLADITFFYLKNESEHINYPMIVAMPEKHAFRKTHLYNKLLGCAAKGDISVHKYGIPIFKYLERQGMADSNSYSTAINMIHNTKELELRNKKLRWFDYLYMKAKKNNSCKDSHTATYMYMECAQHYPSKRKNVIQAFIDTLTLCQEETSALEKHLIMLDDSCPFNIKEIQEIIQAYAQNGISMSATTQFLFHTRTKTLVELIKDKNAFITSNKISSRIYDLLIRSITRHGKGSFKDLMAISEEYKNFSSGANLHYELLYYVSRTQSVPLSVAQTYYKKLPNNTDYYNMRLDLIYGKVLIQYTKLEAAQLLLNSLKLLPIPVEIQDGHYTVDLTKDSAACASYLQVSLELKQLLLRRMKSQKACTITIIIDNDNGLSSNDSQSDLSAAVMDVLNTVKEPSMIVNVFDGKINIDLHAPIAEYRCNTINLSIW